MNIPKDLVYTETHEWIREEGDCIVLGLTDHAQHELGDIVFVELPEIDDEFSEKDTIGTIESVKAVSEFYCPVDGKIVEINEDLEDSPELTNESPYDEAWLVKIEPSEPFNRDEFLSADAYEELLSSGE